MIDTTTQLAILSDALVKIIDLCPLATTGKAESADLLTQAGDIAAQALTAAATYGPLPPFADPSAPQSSLASE
ncbi:MAG: Uncharacterized protein FD139_3624 [Methylocystaceae bacterium]|nr:MAG: Uncharacterized protein FD148_1324 [Methylocystaceae bacterium]KAF0212185.1 MAG: hypothetical protein FD172_1393 [Methylocystaceae bacterium]TXT42416.1 MAG: Uncharacterized protein FD139_3624 [Methylocystaceae bacterium]